MDDIKMGTMPVNRLSLLAQPVFSSHVDRIG